MPVLNYVEINRLQVENAELMFNHTAAFKS